MAKINNSIDTFHGFWKMFGVTATFLIGIAFTWWGVNLFANDFMLFRLNTGAWATILLAPMITGIALTWLSFAEFLRIIREPKSL